MQTLYQVGQRVQYNSLLCAGAAYGTITNADNSITPHVYTIEPDLFKEKEQADIVKEHDIYGQF